MVDTIQWTVFWILVRRPLPKFPLLHLTNFNTLSLSRRNPCRQTHVSTVAPHLNILQQSCVFLSPIVKFRAPYSARTACSANSFTVQCLSSSMRCSVMATAMTVSTATERPLQWQPAVGTLPHLNTCIHIATARYDRAWSPNAKQSRAISGAENCYFHLRLLFDLHWLQLPKGVASARTFARDLPLYSCICTCN